MTVWMFIANLLLLITAIGTIPVWLQTAEISNAFAIVLCFATLVIAMVTSLLVVRKATITKKKRYLLFALVPVAVFLNIIIFRDIIITFLFDILMPIGPGGMITPSELTK